MPTITLPLSMSKHLPTSLIKHVAHLPALRFHLQHPRTVILLLLPIITALRLFRNNYKLWRSLGPGAFPFNPLGYLIQCALRFPLYLFCRESRDLFGTKCYDDPRVRGLYGDIGGRAFLREQKRKGGDFGLERRRGERPEVPGFVVPQRQIGGTAGKGKQGRRIRELQANLLEEIASANPTLTILGVSRLEKHGPALLLSPSLLPSPLPLRLESHSRGEIAHFHHISSHGEWCGIPDGSAHVNLSLEDAREVLAKGWGQRHLLSGAFGGRVGGGHGYVMINGRRK